jgi:insertion element IS1 protein InsB
MPLEPETSWEDIETFEPYLNEEFFLNEINDPLMRSVYEKKEGVLYELYRCEADEMWSFVGSKAVKQWIWLVMNTANRQIIAFHLGGRGKEDAELLFDKVALIFKEKATFFTDFWSSYDILESDKHIAAGKNKGYTNHIERFNNTLRQRCSRLVRQTLAFSKKLLNHIGAIKYFICHYNKFLALLL